MAQYSGATGAHVWSRRFGGTGADFAAGVAVDASGAVFVAGSFNGVVDFGSGALTSAGGLDVFVAQYDSAAGTYRWSRRGGGASDDKSSA